MAKKPQKGPARPVIVTAPVVKPKFDRAAAHKRRMEKQARKKLKVPRGSARAARRAGLERKAA